MGAINHPNRQPVPPAAVSRILSRFSRDDLEGFVAVAIDLMDLADGDADLENANDLEDDFTLTDQALGYGSRGPGCEISDAGGGNVEDTGEAIDEREPEECEYGLYGLNQDAPISDENPALI